MKFIAFQFLTLLMSFTAQAETWQTTILQDAEKLYRPVAEKHFQKKFTIVIEKNVSEAASADHLEKEMLVKINTGLLESKRLTPDSLRMVVCHELGHLFGGAPRRNNPPEWEGPVATDGYSYTSSEGQADYYATLVCFRLLAASTRVGEPRTDLKRAGPVLLEKCKDQKKEKDLCVRTALAGMDFLNLIKDFPISCETTDPQVADRMIRDSYPSRQCRLDTLINGARCMEDINLVLHFFDQKADDCKASVARRPVCWFP